MGNIVQPLWAECPACTRIIVTGYPCLSMALSVLEQAAPHFVAMGFDCTLYTVVKEWYFWTMITGAFFRPFAGGMSFLFMLFEVYMGMQLFPTKEKELGSLCFAFWVCLMNFCVNVIFLVTMYLVSVVQEKRGIMYWMKPNQGLWPLVFIAISLQVLADPTGSTSFWGVVSIPNKWYPLCLLGFFSLMSQDIMWNCAAAVLIGYLYPRLRLERVLPSRVRANRLETRCCGRCCNANWLTWREHSFCLSGTWLMAADTSGYEIESGDRRYATVSDFGRSGTTTQLANQRNSEEQASQAAPSTQFVPFGGGGNRLGDGGEAAVALDLPSAA